MRFRHPNEDTLRRWLTNEGDTALDDHLSTCIRCAASIERLAAEAVDGEAVAAGDDPGEVTADAEAGDSALRQALAAALAPADGLADRLVDGVSTRLSGRQVAGLVADVFAAGFETSRLLLTEGNDDTD